MHLAVVSVLHVLHPEPLLEVAKRSLPRKLPRVRNEEDLERETLGWNVNNQGHFVLFGTAILQQIVENTVPEESALPLPQKSLNQSLAGGKAAMVAPEAEGIRRQS